MTNPKYTRARDATVALNRLRRPSVRLRSGERKTHLERDRALARALWHDPNILGFGVGPKVSKEGDKDICLIFFVRRKLAKRRLRDLVAVPKYLALDTLGTRVLTDVQVWGGPPVSHGLVSSGASIGDLSGNSGTMTLAVQDNSTGNDLILSCSHVLARCGAGQVGDQVESPADPSSDPQLNVVGSLVRFTEIDRHSPDNEVDAAVAKPNDGVNLSNDIPTIGTASGIRDLTLEGDSVVGLQVQKFGAITGRQTGQIRNIHVSTSIVYRQLSGDPSVDFIELVQYDGVSQEGDSGAPVLDTADSPNVVGMHIAGSSDGTASLFTHVQFVFDAMQVSL
jgi:hypothetical protein